MGAWFEPNSEPALIIGNPIIVEDQGEVLISVANIPGQGLAGIAIDAGGITYNEVRAASITVTGLNGFKVLAYDFTTDPGKGRLVAVNPSTGNIGGTILRIKFEASGADPVFALDSSEGDKIRLGSNLDTIISDCTLGKDKAYYVK
jgi:hypothetical protein